MSRARAARGSAGFTMIELLVVVAIVAIAAGITALAMRDPAATRLDREAVRLAALLDSARAEARSLGLPVRWQPLTPTEPTADQFKFTGLPPSVQMPSRWLTEGVTAEVVGAMVLRLGPEATIGPQRVELRLDKQRVLLRTDGIGPFEVVDSEGAGS